MTKKIFHMNESCASAVLDFISDTLREYKFKDNIMNEALLLSDEILVRMMEHAPENAPLRIGIRNNLGIADIKMEMEGTAFSIEEESGIEFNFDTEQMSKDTEIAIRNILIRAFADKIRYRNKGGYNSVRITAGQREKQLASITGITLLVAVWIGLFLKLFFSAEMITQLNVLFLTPAETMLIHSLKLITAPAIFFSMVCCVFHLLEFSDPGSVSKKVFVSYTVTSVSAVLIGIGAFRLLKPGDSGLFSNLVADTAAARGANGGMSILDTFVSIIPSNVIDPFFEVNSLQLVFMALVCGVAINMVGNYSVSIKTFFEAGNELFSKIVSMVVSLMPMFVFVSTVSMLATKGLKVVLSVFGMVLTVMAGFFCMVLLYGLIILIAGKINPLVFWKKYLPTMKETFFLGSGISAIPKTMRTCRKELGISSKVYSFSIPFGATVNMDGNCIYLAVAGLYLARMCGIEIFGQEIISMIFSIVVLSIGAPITPGSALLCLFVLLSQMGVSLDVIALIMGVNFLIELVLAMSNTLGDVAISLVVAKSEGMLDQEIYYKKKRDSL